MSVTPNRDNRETVGMAGTPSRGLTITITRGIREMVKMGSLEMVATITIGLAMAMAMATTTTQATTMGIRQETTLPAACL